MKLLILSLFILVVAAHTSPEDAVRILTLIYLTDASEYAEKCESGLMPNDPLLTLVDPIQDHYGSSWSGFASPCCAHDPAWLPCAALVCAGLPAADHSL